MYFCVAHHTALQICDSVQIVHLLLFYAAHAGPMSVARTTVEPHNGKNFKVKYLPAEVGTYTITLLWNDVEVECEFHAVPNNAVKHCLHCCCCFQNCLNVLQGV